MTYNVSSVTLNRTVPSTSINVTYTDGALYNMIYSVSAEGATVRDSALALVELELSDHIM